MSDADRDALRIAAEKRNCTPYLLLPVRTLAQARKDISNG